MASSFKAPAPEFPALVPALIAEAPTLVAYLGANVLASICCRLVVQWVWPKHKDPWALADGLVSMIVFPLLTWAALAGVLALWHDVELRWTGVTFATRFFCLLYCARGIVHCFMQPLTNMSRLHLAAMTLHHILSVICFGAGVVTGRMHFWGCLDGCCEMSTIFLNNMGLMKDMTINGKTLQHVLPKWIYSANGFLLWLAFLVFRICLFPAWLYLWYCDVQAFPERTWDRSTTLERYMYPGVTIFLALLSYFWFASITKGMLKALGLLQKKNGKVEDKEH